MFASFDCCSFSWLSSSSSRSKSAKNSSASVLYMWCLLQSQTILWRNKQNVKIGKYTQQLVWELKWGNIVDTLFETNKQITLKKQANLSLTHCSYQKIQLHFPRPSLWLPNLPTLNPPPRTPTRQSKWNTELKARRLQAMLRDSRTNPYEASLPTASTTSKPSSALHLHPFSSISHSDSSRIATEEGKTTHKTPEWFAPLPPISSSNHR